MEMLTTKEVAELKGCDIRTIQRLVKSGELESEVFINARKQKEYLIPLTALDIELQHKYLKQNKVADTRINNTSPTIATKPLDKYSEPEREEISLWLDLVERWQGYRNKAKNKTDVDELFCSAIKLEHPDIEISPDTLYRRWSAIKRNDYDGLVDKRGKWKKGKSTVNTQMWDAFLYYYLDEAQHPVTKCYQYMCNAIKEDYPEMYDSIPHDSSFRRKMVNDIPQPLRVLGREGEKAYRDQCGYYIRREYDNMQSNDYWIGDTHTIDVQSRNDDGVVHRLYLSAWMDARSGVFVGWNIATSSSSQNTLLALRHGILRNGIPKTVYVDNGREFLNHDIGGLGHRARKPKDGMVQYAPPPIFARLGITMTNAIVKNARAKTIERRFKDFKDQISRTFGTYTGGHIKERPEILKTRIKNGEIIIDNELIEQVNNMIEHYMNYEEYHGAVKADHGKRKIDVYNEHLKVIRNAVSDELNLMLMRSSRVQTYGRRGVHLDINGERFDYMNEELRQALFGKKVYFRYDPNNLSEVRIYDLEDKWIANAICDDKMVLAYGASKDNIKVAQKQIRTAERTDKDALQAVRTLGFKSARELTLAQAMENQNTPADPANTKVISVHRAQETPLFKQAVGYADLDTMNKNALKKQEGNKLEK